jgi:hypothetical protein
MRIDIRSLLAATAVAAFAASTWHVDPGWAVAVTAIMAAAGAVRLGLPYGVRESVKATVSVLLIGIFALLIGLVTQYLLCGPRPGLLWGTVAAVSWVVIAFRTERIARATLRVLGSAILGLLATLVIRYYVTSHEQQLMAHHYADVVYSFPSLGTIDTEPTNIDATPVRTRLRILLGIARVNSLVCKSDLNQGDWSAVSKINSLTHLNFNYAKIGRLDDINISQFTSKPTLCFFQCELAGESLAKIVSATNTGFLLLSCTPVESFKGLSQASSLRELVFSETGITDELLNELVKLPSLGRLTFYENAAATDEQLAKLKEAIPGLIVVVK